MREEELQLTLVPNEKTNIVKVERQKYTKLSNELQVGKAGEYFVCADLIIQGFNAFPSDQGLPYDVVVDVNEKLVRVQVKSTQEAKIYDTKRGSRHPLYRFQTKRAKGGKARFNGEADVYAFVALDIRKIAYMTDEEMISRNGNTKVLVEFRSREYSYQGRVYPNGKQRKGVWGMYLEDYSEFKY